MSIRDKEKVDQMPWAKERIAEAQAALDATGNLEDPAVIEALLNVEKKCRLSNDSIATKLVAATILQMCRAKRAWATHIARTRARPAARARARRLEDPRRRTARSSRSGGPSPRRPSAASSPRAWPCSRPSPRR